MRMSQEKKPINGATEPSKRTALSAEQIASLIPSAMKIISQSMRDDPDYRRTWIANIAMSNYDAWMNDAEVAGFLVTEEMRLQIHRLANVGAESFIDLLSKDERKETAPETHQ